MAGGQAATACALDMWQTTAGALAALRAAVPVKVRRSFFVRGDDLVAQIRWVKDADEIRKMRRAAALGCRLFEGVLEHMVEGATETEVAAHLEFTARMAGAEGMSFATIVAGGKRSAMPHGTASRAKLPKRGFVTLDFGVVLDGYCSDMTRTVHNGWSVCAREGRVSFGAGSAGCSSGCGYGRSTLRRGR